MSLGTAPRRLKDPCWGDEAVTMSQHSISRTMTEAEQVEKKMMRVMPREDSSVVNITRSEGAQKQNLEKSFHSMQYRTKIPRKLKYYYYHVSKQES